jgi:hypothetical protein
MKRTKFVPTAECLETRVALSGLTGYFNGIRFLNGLPVLTTPAINSTYSAIQSAYVSFATSNVHNFNNYKLLSFNLGKAVNRVPFNVRDGLKATIQGEVPTLQANILSNTPMSVITSFQAAVSDVKTFIQSEVAAGIFVVT